MHEPGNKKAPSAISPNINNKRSRDEADDPLAIQPLHKKLKKFRNDSIDLHDSSRHEKASDTPPETFHADAKVAEDGTFTKDVMSTQNAASTGAARVTNNLPVTKIHCSVHRSILDYNEGLWQRGYFGKHSRVLERKYLTGKQRYSLTAINHRENKGLQVLFQSGLQLAEQASATPRIVPDNAGLELARRYRAVRPPVKNDVSDYDDLSAWLRGQNFHPPADDFTSPMPSHVQAADDWVPASKESATAAWDAVLLRMQEKGGPLPQFRMPPSGPLVLASRVRTSSIPQPFSMPPALARTSTSRTTDATSSRLSLIFSPLSTSPTPSDMHVRHVVENVLHAVECSVFQGSHLERESVAFAYERERYLNVDPRFLDTGWDQVWAPTPDPQDVLLSVNPAVENSLLSVIDNAYIQFPLEDLFEPDFGHLKY